MNLGALPLTIVIVGTVMALVGVACALPISRPFRIGLWTDPKEGAGLAFENVDFTARDGVRLKGWFIPSPTAAGPGPLTVLVHGWLWNRLGTRSDNLLTDFPSGKPVSLLPLAKALTEHGHHVLMFDFRNHGQSGRRGVYTGGWLESRDLVAALEHVAGRPEVDPKRIGVVGFSVGGNMLLNALPFTTRVRAGIAVQPADVHGFQFRYYRQFLGPVGGIVDWLARRVYSLAGGPELSALHPMYVAPGCGQVPVLFVQGTGDRWGGVEDVKRMVAATPNPVAPIFPETAHRFDGYNWAVGNPEVVLAFFDEHMTSA